MDNNELLRACINNGLDRMESEGDENFNEINEMMLRYFEVAYKLDAGEKISEKEFGEAIDTLDVLDELAKTLKEGLMAIHDEVVITEE